MTSDTPQDSDSENRVPKTTAISDPYKVLGDLSDPNGGVGVLGRNAAGSGVTKGVEGRVDSPDGYGLATPDDARIGGTLAAASGHVVTVTGKRAVRVDPESSGFGGNVVHGHSSNSVSDTASAATIGGGGFDNGSTSNPNRVLDNYGTVGGGLGNDAGGNSSTVAGGSGNTAGEDGAAVGGGYENEASGASAVVGGGDHNDARGQYATVGGGGPLDDGDIYPDRINEAAADYATVGGGGDNGVFDHYGTVAGGAGNVAGNDDADRTTQQYATVGGGENNAAGGPYATVAGGANNRVNAAKGTVAGGGWTDTNNRAATANRVYDDYGTVGGGGNNQAGTSGSTDATYATVAGGQDNEASGHRATVAGGGNNQATAEEATVGGGNLNTASGNNGAVPGGVNNVAGGAVSFAAGSSAAAVDDYAFVWNDGYNYHSEGLSSAKDVAGSGVTGINTFHVSANGGVRFITGPNSVTYISGGSTGWSTASSRAVKTNVDSVEPEAALEGVAEMDVCTWEYADEDGDGAGVTHVGPMAEDFHAAFDLDLGDSDEHINSINADGVAFAAIQGLAAQADDREARIEALEADVEAKDARIDDLEAAVETRDDRIEAQADRIAALEAETERLYERLDALTARLDPGDAAPADD